MSRSAVETDPPPRRGQSRRLAPRGAGWRLTKRASPTTSEPLLRAFYPSLPEPRRRIDLALWAVVVEVNMSLSDAIGALAALPDLLGQR